jgi:hypothetical protein
MKISVLINFHFFKTNFNQQCEVCADRTHYAHVLTFMLLFCNLLQAQNNNANKVFIEVINMLNMFEKLHST